MKNKLFLFLFSFCSFSSIFCEEIVINLPTEKDDVKIYFCSCKSANKKLANLTNNVLSADFTQDARAIVFAKTSSTVEIENKTGDAFYQTSFWKKNHIQYVVLPTIKNNVLSVDIFDTRKNSIQSLTKMQLFEDHKENVMTLHYLSDFLMEMFIGSKGIASKTVLYSFKPEQRHTVPNLWKAEIYETDSLGLFHKRKTFENNYCINPEYLKKGNKDAFVYVCYKLGQPQIYLKSRQKTAQSIVSLRGNQLLPKPSLDGNYLCFISDASGTSDVFVKPLSQDSKPIQVYSARNQTCASASLSPDNSKIAFVNDKTGNAKVYLADIKDTLISRKLPKIVRIKSPCGECTSPSFSPDGTKLAYSGKINGIRQIWLYDLETKESMQVTNGHEDKENPSFGSDSNHLVYNTTTDAKDIYLLNCRTKKTRKLTQGTGDKHYPAFEK